MPIYSDDAQLYHCFETLFSRIEEHDNKATNALLKASLAIQFACTDPPAAITIDARRAPIQVIYGPTAVKPTVEVGLTADTLHCLLLGDIRLSKAIGQKLLDLKGPVWKTMALADLFHYAQQFYPIVLQNKGLPTTCPELGRG